MAALPLVVALKPVDDAAPFALPLAVSHDPQIGRVGEIVTAPAMCQPGTPASRGLLLIGVVGICHGLKHSRGDGTPLTECCDGAAALSSVPERPGVDLLRRAVSFSDGARPAVALQGGMRVLNQRGKMAILASLTIAALLGSCGIIFNGG